MTAMRVRVLAILTLAAGMATAQQQPRDLKYESGAAEAKPAAITQTRIVTVGFIVSPYFFAGGTGLLAGPAGSRS